MNSTIAALATPLGRSGIGVIRLSGTDSLSIAQQLTSDKVSFQPRHASLASLIDPTTREPIDEAIVTYFRSPNSFTGEDVVEIACHGSPVVLRQVIDICLSLDARLAEPGEFSLRALANGRMDLAEAEAIRDIIDAQTAASARQAVRQLRGEFSHELQPIKDELLDLVVLLESTLEFVEDDLPEMQFRLVKNRMASIAERIDNIAGTFQAGRLLREGLKVALVGRPNVGKSSLFNALLGVERAIVTEVAGTTRDQLHERFTIDDVPISLIDTAGLRKTTDTVESIGVERSKRTMADADTVVVMFDVTEPITGADREILASVEKLKYLIVFNKVDVADVTTIEERTRSLNAQGTSPLLISAKTGEGLEGLKRSMLEPFSTGDTSRDGFMVSDARHYDLLIRAAANVRESITLFERAESEEIVLIGLHNALCFLGEITGETTTEDMLTRIFSTFCIGK